MKMKIKMKKLSEDKKITLKKTTLHPVQNTKPIEAISS